MEANRWNSPFFQFLTSDALKKKALKEKGIEQIAKGKGK